MIQTLSYFHIFISFLLFKLLHVTYLDFYLLKIINKLV